MAVKSRSDITLSAVVDVASVTRYYLLQDSTLNPPAKPTVNPPAGWVVAEPTYTEGSTNSLYICDLTAFCDSTFSFSEVSLSSSFEAAKAAYNKAAAAQETANQKNAAYYQATAPAGTGYKINDIWFDTANGGKMYYWNGSAWTALTFGKDAITAGAITAEKLQVDQAFINAIIASSIAAQAIDIEASGDAGMAIIKTKINVDNEYELDIAAGVGTGQAHVIISPGLVNIYGTELRISVDNLEFDVPYTSNTYTSFTGSVLSGGSIVVCTKAGSCQVFGYLKPSASVTDFTQVLDAVKVPAPQHGANITPTVPSWYSASDLPARVRVQAAGGLAIQGGTANREYNFSITYPTA